MKKWSRNELLLRADLAVPELTISGAVELFEKNLGDHDASVSLLSSYSRHPDSTLDIRTDRLANFKTRVACELG